MIANSEYLEIKARLLLTADTAGRLATEPSQSVFYDQEQYQAVMDAFVRASADVVRLTAEMDLLRLMFSERLSEFLMEGNGNGNAAATMESVQDSADRPRGQAEQHDDTATGSGVRPGGATGQPEGRPKPRRNKARNRRSQGAVGRDDGAESVDGSQNQE